MSLVWSYGDVNHTNRKPSSVRFAFGFVLLRLSSEHPIGRTVTLVATIERRIVFDLSLDLFSFDVARASYR